MEGVEATGVATRGALGAMKVGPRRPLDGDEDGMAVTVCVGELDALGADDGLAIGFPVGVFVGRESIRRGDVLFDGLADGVADGIIDGIAVGTLVGGAVGHAVGTADGLADGAGVGARVGYTVGSGSSHAISVGCSVGGNGLRVILAIGLFVGRVTGALVGITVGLGVGCLDGRYRGYWDVGAATTEEYVADSPIPHMFTPCDRSS